MTGWPWPGDTSLERARRIACSLLALLPDPDERAGYIAIARRYGETWLGESLVLHDDTAVVTTAEAADIAHVHPGVIRRWHSEGHLPAVARGRYVVAEVRRCAETKRKTRATRTRA
jgi:hypothetical protein